MKKLLFTIWAMLLVAISSYADSISVSNVTLKGDVATSVSVNLTNTTTNITGYQMDITFPEGVVPVMVGDSMSLSKGYRCGGTYNLKGKNIGGNTYRVAYLSTSMTPISYKSGVLFTMTLKNSTSAEGTFKGTVSNIVLSCSDGTEQKPSDTSFSVEVKNLTKEDLEMQLASLEKYLYSCFADIDVQLDALNVGDKFFQYTLSDSEMNSYMQTKERIEEYFANATQTLESEGTSILAKADTATTQETFSALYKRTVELEGVVYDLRSVSKLYANDMQNMVEESTSKTINFPDQTKCYSITTKDAKTGIQMGYKSQYGFVLTSAGRMMFEQVEDNTFRLKDPDGNYVVQNTDGSLKAGKQSEATVWTGSCYEYGGTYRFSGKSGELYCGGTSFNSAFTKGYGYFTITESTLTAQQAADNLKAETYSTECNRTSWRVSNKTDVDADYVSIRDAMSNYNVTDGDTLFIEPGSSVYGDITKSVVVIGPGYDLADSSNDATLQGTTIKAAGVQLIGLNLSYDVYVNENDITIRNCRIQKNIRGNSSSSVENANCTIQSNFIQGNIIGAGEDNAMDWNITYNIILGNIQNLSCAFIDHNTMVTSGSYALKTVTASELSDNILFSTVADSNPVQDCSDNSYEYNITSYGQLEGINKSLTPLSSLLTCEGTTLSEEYYKPIAAACNYSSDGTLCGAIQYSGTSYIFGGKTGEYRTGTEEEVLSGDCGLDADNVIKWRIDKQTATLYLEGSGRMAVYDNPQAVPWYSSASLIRHLSFTDSISHITQYAFSQLPNLTDSIILPKLLKSVGYLAFDGTPITSVVFSQALDSIDKGAFRDTNLRSVVMNMVCPPYGFNSQNIKAGSGVLTMYVPKDQQKRYESTLKNWSSDWSSYYACSESDYDCGYDECNTDFKSTDNHINEYLTKPFYYLGLDSSPKGLVYKFAENSILTDPTRENVLAEIYKASDELYSHWQELLLSQKCIMNFLYNTYSNDYWNYEASGLLSDNRFKSYRIDMENIEELLSNYIAKYGVNEYTDGIGGNITASVGTKSVSWSLDGATGKLTITGQGAMNKGNWSYWISRLVKHIVISDSITSIAKQAFVKAAVLDTMTCHATAVPELLDNVFAGSTYNTTGVLLVPASALELYKAATYWKDWANIRSIEVTPDFPEEEMTAGTLDHKATLDIENDVYNSLDIFFQALSVRGIEAASVINVAGQTFSMILSSQSYEWIKTATLALENSSKYFYMTSKGGAVFNFTLSDAFALQHQDDMATVLATIQSMACHIITSGITIYINGNKYTYDGFQIEPNDLLALKNLYQRFGGENWQSYYQWNFATGGRNANDFHGVTFTDPDQLGYSYVKTIDLGKAGVKGDVTNWVLYFPELVSLSFYVGKLEGDLTGFVSQLSKLKSLDVSYNMLTGLTSLPPSVTSLDKGYQLTSDADQYIAAANPVKVYISQSQTQTLPTIMTYDLATNSNKPTTLYIMERGNTWSNSYYGTLVPQSTTDFVYGTQWIGNPYVYSYEQDHPVYLRTSDHCIYPAKLLYESGDADMTGYTDVLDVQTTITEILNPTKVPLFNHSAANTYADQVINVQDIVCTVNIVLDNLQPQQEGAKQREASACTTSNAIYTEGEGLFVTTDTQLGAIDVELAGVSTGQVGLMLNRRDFQLLSRNTASGSRHVIFSPSGKAIPVGTTQLLRISDDSAQPVYATLSSIDATRVDAAIGSRPTDIQLVNTASDVDIRLSDGNIIVTTTQPLQGVSFRVMTMGGVTAFSQNLTSMPAGSSQLQANIPEGIYIVSMTSEGQNSVNVKLINK